MEQLELEKLVRDCKKGKNDAYSQLVDQFSGKFYAYFYRLTGSAELSNELLSELFLKIVKYIKKFRDGSFETWLFKIASNIFYDYLRSKQSQQKLADGYTEQLVQNQQTNKASTIDTNYHLQNALSKISPDDRELIVLRYYSDMSFKDIAELRQEPLGTTLSKTHRALKKLKNLLEKNENE